MRPAALMRGLMWKRDRAAGDFVDFQPGFFNQRQKSRMMSGDDPLQTFFHNNAVFTAERHAVGHRAERRENQRLFQERPARVLIQNLRRQNLRQFDKSPPSRTMSLFGYAHPACFAFTSAYAAAIFPEWCGGQ